MRITLGSGAATQVSSANSDQWYYWTDAWQQNEKKALKELNDGAYVEFDNINDALAWLNDPE
ncbi:hypothetical protein ACL9RL_07335 [Plantibacter sp. Mn2098]|uniref:hypothetical protein n=1 Tax=Plantibacter sp. Mn2098 TaxID=3395266 RepID=UPI003BBA35EF